MKIIAYFFLQQFCTIRCDYVIGGDCQAKYYKELVHYANFQTLAKLLDKISYLIQFVCIHSIGLTIRTANDLNEDLREEVNEIRLCIAEY